MFLVGEVPLYSPLIYICVLWPWIGKVPAEKGEGEVRLQHGNQGGRFIQGYLAHKRTLPRRTLQ